jgi:hypothetical protein
MLVKPVRAKALTLIMRHVSQCFHRDPSRVNFQSEFLASNPIRQQTLSLPPQFWDNRQGK